MKKVCDVMNKNLITIESDFTFEKSLKIMKEHNIGKLPVMENSKLIGVVTREDILIRKETAPLPPIVAFWDLLITLPENKSFKEKLKKLSGYTAKDIMSTNYLAVKKGDDLSPVITQIIEQKYNYALVVEDEVVLGILTKTDLINKCFN